MRHSVCVAKILLKNVRDYPIKTEKSNRRCVMPDCSLIKTCIFFNDKMADIPSTAEIFKNLYCKNDFDDCARMIVVKALGREKVPADLFPNQSAKALEIVKNG
jgi:hypothetical protein